MSIYLFVLLATSWSPYNRKTLATYKSMELLITGIVKNNFIFEKGEEKWAELQINTIELLSNLITQVALSFLRGRGGQSIKRG